MSQPVLELKDASIFQRESLILSDVSVTIEKGEFVYLIGKTGSGKSSENNLQPERQGRQPRRPH